MKNEIIKLERTYWDGMANHDYETVRSMTRFPCIVAGKRGVMSVDEPAYKTMFEQGADKKIAVTSITDEQVQVGDDHAMIGYLIALDYDGETMQCACTSTWIKEGDNWLCVMHTESDLEKKV